MSEVPILPISAISTEFLFLGCLWFVIIWTAWVDWHSLRIPALASPILIILGTIRLVGTHGNLEAIWTSALGSILTGCALYLIGYAFKKLRGTSGLGSADPLYAAALALWVDPLSIPWAIMTACVFTLAIFATRAWLNLFDLRYGLKIPFAPGLGFGFGVLSLIEVMAGSWA